MEIDWLARLSVAKDEQVSVVEDTHPTAGSAFLGSVQTH
jgi:hypothetical protein